jgi:hypothetical protein
MQDTSQKEEEDYDLDAVLDGPVISNFLSTEQETISPRELTFRKDEMRISEEPSYSVATVAAFILACCIAHFFLVTQGFMGTKGLAKMDAFAARVQEFFNKYSVHVPEGVELIRF